MGETDGCCYSGCDDCSTATNYCAQSAARCHSCGGHLSSELKCSTATTTPAAWTDGCCYTGCNDCSNAENYCAQSAARCHSCGGHLSSELNCSNTAATTAATTA